MVNVIHSKRKEIFAIQFVELTNPNFQIMVLLKNKILDIGLLLIHSGQMTQAFQIYGKQTSDVDFCVTSYLFTVFIICMMAHWMTWDILNF